MGTKLSPPSVKVAETNQSPTLNFTERDSKDIEMVQKDPSVLSYVSPSQVIQERFKQPFMDVQPFNYARHTVQDLGDKTFGTTSMGACIAVATRHKESGVLTVSHLTIASDKAEWAKWLQENVPPGSEVALVGGYRGKSDSLLASIESTLKQQGLSVSFRDIDHQIADGQDYSVVFSGGDLFLVTGEVGSKDLAFKKVM